MMQGAAFAVELTSNVFGHLEKTAVKHYPLMSGQQRDHDECELVSHAEVVSKWNSRAVGLFVLCQTPDAPSYIRADA